MLHRLTLKIKKVSASYSKAFQDSGQKQLGGGGGHHATPLPMSNRVKQSTRKLMHVYKKTNGYQFSFIKMAFDLISYLRISFSVKLPLPRCWIGLMIVPCCNTLCINTLLSNQLFTQFFQWLISVENK